jgi:hypothetical protein
MSNKELYLAKVSSLASRFENYEEIMKEAEEKYEKKNLSKKVRNKTIPSRI